MKKYIFIPEHLLLIWIICLPVFVSMYVSNSILDVQTHDRFGMLPTLHGINWMLGISGSVSYLCHLFLRKANKRQRYVCNIHIGLSILTSFLVVADFYGNIPLKAYSVEVAHNAAVSYFSVTHNIFQMIFIAIQMLFVGYCCLRLFWPYNKNRI